MQETSRQGNREREGQDDVCGNREGAQVMWIYILEIRHGGIVTLSIVINDYYFFQKQGSRQTSNTLVTINNPCHDHVNRAAAEVN